MRNYILTLLFIFICASQTKAQKKDTFIVRTEFANQGEQEDYWAEKFFYESYIKETYKRFTGNIAVIDENNILFGNKILQGDFSPELKEIFIRGIFYPQVITGDAVAAKKTEEEINKMTEQEKLFYTMAQNDTLSIGNFEELEFLSKKSTTKRFRFWEYRKWSANPQVYFIELTNMAANKSTDMASFIKGATLTFVKYGWVVM